MTNLKRLVLLGAAGAFACLFIAAPVLAAEPNRLPDLGDAERIVVPGDGLELAAYLFRPQTPNGLRPAIVALHGGFNSAWWMRGISRRIARAGYFVLAPSLRGGSGSDFAPLACDLKADDIVETIA